MTTNYHPSIQHLSMPDRIKALPVDERGFPVPRFVAWINGKADHRVINVDRFRPALESKLCWICGGPMGRYYTSVIGCMCAVNRVISEPPSHRDCAEFSVKACPFLSRPGAHRREAGLPEDRIEPGGLALLRNPGVACLWTSKDYPKAFRAWEGAEGVLFRLGNPVETTWYREGRLATYEEVLAAINDGLPALQQVAAEQSEEAVKDLDRLVVRALDLLPRAA